MQFQQFSTSPGKPAGRVNATTKHALGWFGLAGCHELVASKYFHHADVYEVKPIAPENERFGNRKFEAPFTLKRTAGLKPSRSGYTFYGLWVVPVHDCSEAA